MFRLLSGFPPRLRRRRRCCEAGYADQSRVRAFAGVRSTNSNRTFAAALASERGRWRRGAIQRRAIRIAAAVGRLTVASQVGRLTAASELVRSRGKALDHLLWAYCIRALRKESYCGC